MLDLAIIGGGVAGCYCAYRLAHDSTLDNVELFEASDRIGGRLWSVQIKESGDIAGAPIELGGNWFGEGQKSVYKLITEALKLTPSEVGWKNEHWFLRGAFLTECDFRTPKKVPYRLRGDERKKQPYDILDSAIENILGRPLDTLWPNTNKASPQETLLHLRGIKRDGRELWQWGFWNLLAEVVSPEAYEFMLAGVGITSTFRNTNAYDAIWLVLFEGAMGDVPLRLPKGYQSLPLELERQSSGRVTFNKGYTLTRVERREPERSLALHFKTRDGKVEFRETRRVILALPRRALQLIKMDHDVVNSETFRDDLDAVLPVPACKLYLVFDRPWWTKSRIRPSFFEEDKVFASYTDLPMRQCYYFRDDNSDQQALVMACYADHVATSFWSVLAETTDHEFSSQNWLAIANVPRGSAAMVRAARQQLSAMHGGIVVPDTKWLPNYCDWAIDPFGAAWHAWAPHKKSWEVRKRMRQPNTSVPLYTCGEAFAQFQGWVEGAINSAEMALRHASLARTAGFDLNNRPWWGGLGDEPEFEL